MPNLKFKLTHAGDEIADPDYTLMLGDKPTRVHIQDSRGYGGGYTVNLYSPEGASDDDWFIQSCGTFDRFTDAAIAAKKVYRNGEPK
jgi:hypothetical protein